MDDIVSEMANISPMPSPREGHVSFQDQNERHQAIIEEDRKRAEKLLRDRLRRQKPENKPTEGNEETDGGMTYGGYTGLKGKIVKVNVLKVNRKLGIAVDGGANTNQKAVIIRQIVVSFLKRKAYCLDYVYWYTKYTDMNLHALYYNIVDISIVSIITYTIIIA